MCAVYTYFDKHYRNILYCFYEFTNFSLSYQSELIIIDFRFVIDYVCSCTITKTILVCVCVCMHEWLNRVEPVFV